MNLLGITPRGRTAGARPDPAPSSLDDIIARVERSGGEVEMDKWLDGSHRVCITIGKYNDARLQLWAQSHSYRSAAALALQKAPPQIREAFGLVIPEGFES